jgi:hypothetical protein
MWFVAQAPDVCRGIRRVFAKAEVTTTIGNMVLYVGSKEHGKAMFILLFRERR